MLARWLAHRYALGQSLSFFQDEFAGRVSQKVMQTALAVRETVMTLTDVMVYVGVYFTGAVIVVGWAEPWLMVPLLLWLGGYIGILYYFVPKLREVSMAQADARAEMTGRVVDSYTNIQTVKLFADSRARGRLTPRTSVWTGSLNTRAPPDAPRSPACASRFPDVAERGTARACCWCCIAIWQWSGTVAALRTGDRGRHQPGDAAPGMSRLDHVGGQPAVREHRHGAGRHRTRIAQPHGVTRPSRAPKNCSSVPEGEVRFRRASISATARVPAASSRNCRSEQSSLARKSVIVGRSGAGKTTLVNAPAAASTMSRAAHPDRRTGHRRCRAAGIAARQYRHGDTGHLAAASFDPRQHPPMAGRMRAKR